jgi:hypothetical protein
MSLRWLRRLFASGQSVKDGFATILLGISRESCNVVLKRAILTSLIGHASGMGVIFSAVGFVVGFGQALQLLLANIYLDPLDKELEFGRLPVRSLLPGMLDRRSGVILHRCSTYSKK